MKNKTTILYVSSGGGHLTELQAIKPELVNCREIQVMTHYDPSLDCTVIEGFALGKPLSIINSFLNSFKYLMKEKPDVIITTGAEIAIPLVVLGKTFFRCKVIFVESAAQINTASKTGKVCYWFSDRFYVQWPSTLKAYGKKAQFAGGLLCSL